MSGDAGLIPRLPKGFRDITAREILLREKMIETLGKVYRSFGFAPLETPMVEYLDNLGKYLPESDTPEGGVFAFKDDSSSWVALRYDLTAPLARYVAEHEKDLVLPFRRYQIGPVFRLEKPGPGRFREFYQCDFDTVGAATAAADAEVCCVLAEALEALGLAGNFNVRVNNRKILNGMAQAAGLGDNAESLDRASLIVLRAIDKLDRIGLKGVIELLGKGRKDESGDFTPGAGLSAEQISLFEQYLSASCDSRASVCDTLEKLVEKSATGLEGIAELRQIDEILTGAGYLEDRVLFDPMIVRGLAYYTGPVFEAQLTFEIDGEDGRLKQFGSVAGGGRYDSLVERFLGRKVPSTGASVGIDRLLAALIALKQFDSETSQPPVLVTAMDPSLMKHYHKLTNDLRKAGIPTEIYLGSGGFRKQMKYADQKNLPVAVICGEDEFKNGTVSIKDLYLGRELSKEIEDRAEWAGNRPAQMTVPTNELVETVKKILRNTPS